MKRSVRLKASIIALLVVGGGALAEDQPREILIHEGPVFTTPGLGPKEEIEFTKEFPVDPETLKKQPPVHDASSKLPVTAEKAIELAKADTEAGGRPDEKVVVRLELLPFKRDQNGSTSYYLIELKVDGSEVHRVVLMDGTVVKSRLRRLSVK